MVRRGLPRAAQAVCTFRIDDDDAVARNFVERLRSHAARLGPPAAAITFRDGFYIAPRSRGGMMLKRGKNFGIACGLGLVDTTGEKLRTVYHLSVAHSRIDELYPTLADSSAPMFLVSAHEHCDSQRNESFDTRSGLLSVAEAHAELGENFAAVDLDRLLREFPGLPQEAL